MLKPDKREAIIERNIVINICAVVSAQIAIVYASTGINEYKNACVILLQPSAHARFTWMYNGNNTEQYLSVMRATPHQLYFRECDRMKPLLHVSYNH